MDEASAKADSTARQAQTDAGAIARAAREQARQQAQELVDAAAAEANEIQNIHQLRAEQPESGDRPHGRPPPPSWRTT